MPLPVVTATSAGGVVLDGEGRVALCARRSFKGVLQWGLPKGLVEPNETPEQAAIREANEETGLTVEVVTSLATIDYWFVEPGREGSPARRVHKFVHFFLMRATGGDPSLHDQETEEVALLPPQQSLARVSFDSERKVIEEALSRGGPR